MKLYDDPNRPAVLTPHDAVIENTASGPVIDASMVVSTEDRVVVDINNVAAYYKHAAGGLEGQYSKEDFPKIASPWPRAWFEYRAANAFDGPNNAVDIHVAILVDANSREEGGVRHMARQLVKDREWRFAGQYAWDTDETGAFESGSDVQVSPSFAKSRGVPADDPEAQRQMFHAFIPLWFALTFAHCKNVTTQTHHTPDKVAAKRRKAGKPVGVSYKTLVIDGMKEILRTEGQAEKNGLKKALHICRGHFATYTKDAPLFGKVTGTFWKPMHVRGSKKHGEVRKDYKVAVNDGQSS